MELEKIINMYVEDGMSTKAIAEEFGTYPNKIRRALVSSGVELRSKSAAQKKALENGRAKFFRPCFNFRSDQFCGLIPSPL